MSKCHKVRLPLLARIARSIRHSLLLSGLRPLWSFLRPIYLRVLTLFGGNDGVPINVGGVGKVRIPASALQGDIPHGEIPALVELLRILRPDDVFYDVGASVGLYTFFALNRLGASGEVHAFEPEENSCRILASRLATIRARCSVRINRCFVADQTSQGASIDGLSRDNSTSLDVGSSHHLYLFDPADAARAWHISIDAYIAKNHRPPTLLKCDVEGAELLVLRGAEFTLSQHRPMLLISSHPRLLHYFGHSPAEVETFLINCGYTPRLLNDDGELHLFCTPVGTAKN
jgi:FkbM family methyltransferase